MNLMKKLFKALFYRPKVSGITLDKKNIEEYFSEIEEIQYKKERINAYLSELMQKEEEAKLFERLDKETLQKLEKLSERVKDLEDRKQNLKGRLISTNAALAKIAQYEEDVPDLIKEMGIAEKRRRETESLMVYLKEEKEILAEERESLFFSYKCLKGLSVVFAIVLVLALFISYTMLQLLRDNIWIIVSSIGVVMFLLVIGVVLLKDYLDRELNKNVILQQKAAKYLNKCTIRFFNQTQYLEFQYKKLGIDSVAKLEMFYNRYLKNKNNERMYIQLNYAQADIEEEIQGLLKERGVKYQDLGHLTGSILNPRKQQEAKLIKEDEKRTKEQLQILVGAEQELLKEIILLQKDPELKEEISQRLARFSDQQMLDKILKGA